MNFIKKFIGHTKTVLRHKLAVCKICFKFGLYWQGIIHDMSKFSPTEFCPSVKYYQGDRSPIEAEKEDKGYSMAWLHHKSRNKHHFWYWVDYNNGQVQTPVRIPLKYVYELIADTIAAGKVYSKNAGKEWKQSDPYNYYKAHNRVAQNGVEFCEEATKAVLDEIYVDLMLYGIEYVAKNIKSNQYKKIYDNWETYKVEKYPLLLDKWYK